MKDGARKLCLISFIVESLRLVLKRQISNMRDPTPPEKRVAVGIYKLCSSVEDRAVASLFGVGRSAVNVVDRQFCGAVVSLLESDSVNMMAPEEMAKYMQEFEAVCGFRQCVGALDGCHFRHSPPKQHGTDCHNYKGWHSVILLALVDSKYRFRCVNVGAPGLCHD
ncbi:uncharacterized protein [Dermacentor andersoni]|uniref:uncharacterized protein n=1 Tax=Dermacentor andersoni TaxID=34620 RepID=UPI002155C6CD|nr:uncharacterized protein LOC126537731 [Dermacentor andersoni]